RQMGLMGLTFEDAEALATLPGVGSVAPLAVLEPDVSHQGRSSDARVVGTSAALAGIQGGRVISGRFVADEDDRLHSAVVVLGAKVAHELMPFRDPVGSSISIGGMSFLVIGLMEDRRQSGSRATSME